MLTILLAAFTGYLLVGLAAYFLRGSTVHVVRPLPRDDDPPEPGTEDFLRSLEVLCGTNVEPGNRVEVLPCGDAVFPRLLADLRAARKTITWQVYWFKPGRLADEVAEVLAERARAGVRVLMIFDAIGSKGIDQRYRRRLRDAGVEVQTFRPLQWHTLYKWQQRSHIRAVVIDGDVGYTGGFGIDDRWMGDGRHDDQWRDTSVRLVGPVVDQLQGAFAANWSEITGELLVGEAIVHLPPSQERAGEVSAALMISQPSLGSTTATRLVALLSACARERLWITTAYFVPTPKIRELLVACARRGVDVRVLTPGDNTDREVTWLASQAQYEELIEAGVRLYDYLPTMIHAKTLLVDDQWSVIGTMNLDNRSLMLNDEVIMLSPDRTLAGTLERLFLEDLEYSRPLDMDDVRGRTWRERAKRRLARLVTPLL